MRRAVALTILTLLALGAAWLVWRHFAERRERAPATVEGWPAVVTTIAGDGSPGSADGPAGAGRFADPFGLAVDPLGAVYVADAGDSNRVRLVDPTGVVSTLAGGAEGFVDGVGPAAAFHTPSGLALGPAGTLYVADTGNHTIRMVLPGGRVATLAGDGTPGDEDGPLYRARFNGPIGVAVGPDGAIYVADTYNDRVRRIGRDGIVTTVAGAGRPGHLDGPAATALFDTPSGLGLSRSGAIFVADTGNHAIRRIDTDGEVTTVLGRSPDGGAFFPVGRPIGVAVTHDGFMYVTGSRDGQVVQMSPDGRARTLAGTGRGFAGGDGSTARLNSPAGVALAATGTLVVADTANYLVRRIAPPTAINGVRAPTPPAPLPRLPEARLAREPLGWPVDPADGPHEVVGTLGEMRGNSTRGIVRFHTGLDVYGRDGAAVRAVRSEKVRSPTAAWGFDSDSEGVSLDLITYMHLRVGRTREGSPFEDRRFLPVRDPDDRVTRIRVRRGTRFVAGDPLGTINRLYHVQLDLGPPGAEINPLILPFPGLSDRVPPTIARDGVRLYRADGRQLQERRRGRLIVSGQVRIVVDAYDQVDGNLPRRRLGAYRLGYQVLRPDGRSAPGFEQPHMTIEFDRLPADRRAAALVYAGGSGITAHGSRVTRFLYIITNELRAGEVTPGAWDASALPPGRYTLRIFAADFSGNETRRDVAIVID